jgi:hypothetical protein
MVGAMNSNHTDHVEDVKDEQSFARLGMDVLNNEGIIFVAAVEVVPMSCQICGSRTYV